MALVPGRTDKNICHFSVPRLAPLVRCFSSPSLAPRPCPARVVKLKTEEMERHTRSKRKVRFEEPPVATVRPRRKAAALEPVVVEETAVPGEATLVEVWVTHRLRCAHCGATSPHMRACACAGAEQSSTCARGGAVRNGGGIFHSSCRDGWPRTQRRARGARGRRASRAAASGYRFHGGHSH